MTADSVGSLIIAFGKHNMGYFRNGTFTQSVPTPFSRGAIQPYIQKALEENRWFNIKHWGYYIASIKKILSEAPKHGKGATIILVPPSAVENVKTYFKPIYSFQGDLGISLILNKTIQTAFDHDILLSQKRTVLGRRLEAVARLSCIDGALIITTEWEMLGFGSKLVAPRWEGEIVIGPNAFNFPSRGEQFDRLKFGTRHNSAIDFVGSCPGVVAFVISEDGPIRGLVKYDQNTILCWKDLKVAIVI